MPYMPYESTLLNTMLPFLSVFPFSPQYSVAILNTTY